MGNWEDGRVDENGRQCVGELRELSGAEVADQHLYPCLNLPKHEWSVRE